MADAAAPSTGRVFISYRREETDYAAALLVHELAKRIGRGQIFQDIDSIRPGDDFVEVITAAVASCRVLLAVIDRQWLAVKDEQGRSRLENPNDFVRLEIEAALTRKVRVIPILIGGAPMPSAEQLPPSMARFARLQALELSPVHLESETSRLQQVVDEALADVHPTRDPGPPPVPPPTVIEGSDATPSREPWHSRRLLVWITAAVLVVVAAAGGAWWLHANTTTSKPSGGTSSGTTRVTTTPPAASAFPPIAVGTDPVTVALSRDGKHAYVGNCDCRGSKGYVPKPSVSIIDTATNRVVKTVPVPNSPFEETLVDNDRYLYVSTGGPGPTAVLDTTTNAVVGGVPLPGPALAVADGIAYAVNNYTGSVVMRNLSTPLTDGSSVDYGHVDPPEPENAAVAKHAGPNEAWAIAAGRKNGQLYLASPRGSAIYSAPQNQANPVWTRAFAIPEDTPYQIAVSPDDSFLYVTTAYSPYLYFVNVKTAEVSHITLPAAANALVISSTGSDLYMAGATREVYDVDTVRRTIVRKISLGSQPNGLALTDNGQRLYVTNRLSNTITVVDLTKIPRR